MKKEGSFNFLFLAGIVFAIVGAVQGIEGPGAFATVAGIHFTVLGGFGKLIFFVFRWWKGVPTRVTWGELARAVVVLGITIMFFGAILVFRGVIGEAFNVFVDIGFLNIGLSIPLFLKAIKSRLRRE